MGDGIDTRGAGCEGRPQGMNSSPARCGGRTQANARAKGFASAWSGRCQRRSTKLEGAGRRQGRRGQADGRVDEGRKIDETDESGQSGRNPFERIDGLTADRREKAGLGLATPPFRSVAVGSPHREVSPADRPIPKRRAPRRTPGRSVGRGGKSVPKAIRRRRVSGSLCSWRGGKPVPKAIGHVFANFGADSACARRATNPLFCTTCETNLSDLRFYGFS